MSKNLTRFSSTTSVKDELQKVVVKVIERVLVLTGLFLIVIVTVINSMSAEG